MPEHDPTQTELVAWFKQQTPEQLTDFLMTYINNNPNEKARWDLAMVNDKGGLNKSKISKMLTKALPAKGVWEWNKVAGYFSHANDMFETIFPAIKKCSVVEQWQLILKALQRFNKVLEKIDDSGGFRFDIEGQLNQQLTELFNQQPWPDEEKAEWLFEHFEEYKYDIFPSVPEDFDLTKQVQTLFLSLCEAQAQKQIQLGVDLSIWEDKWALKKLIDPLIEQAKLVGDWQEQSRLMATSAFGVDDYLAIAQVCLDNDSALDSEHWLQKAYQKITSESVSSIRDKGTCQAFEVKLRLALNETKKAWQLAWQLFTNQPSFIGYKKLEVLQQKTGVIDVDFVQNAEQLFTQCYAETSYSITRNADALLDFYIYHQELEKARLWVLSHKATSSTLLTLAGMIVIKHPQESVDLYYRVACILIDEKKNSAYQQAIELLVKLEKMIKESGADDEMLMVMIGKIIQQHKAKRNMMKLLKEYFIRCF